jgi:predicted lipoprotein with Yx(FWY)xxD motif
MSLRASRRWLMRGTTVGAVGLLSLVLAACGSSPAHPSASPNSSTSAASSTGATVDTSTSARYGTILVTGSGMTLYMLTGDSPTKSICNGACTAIWPPLTTTGAPAAGAGVDATLLATITRSNGSRQVSYDGHPLYTYSGDTAAGDVNGEGIHHFGGTWYVLGPSGQPVTAAVSGTSSTSTSGGYGY